MDRDFWLDRWQRNEIGFHESAINVALEEEWPKFGLPSGSAVLVPLCGKSLDMLWLAGQGHHVIGVELSPIAVETFFAEHELTPNRRTENGYEIFEAGQIEIWCGDLFALPASVTADVRGVYDRASLVALPPDMQPKYAAKIAELTRPETQMLLVAGNYDQSEMNGPPFAVSPDQVDRIFHASFAIEKLAEGDVLGPYHRFRQRGLTWMQTAVYRLRRLASTEGSGS